MGHGSTERAQVRFVERTPAASAATARELLGTENPAWECVGAMEVWLPAGMSESARAEALRQLRGECDVRAALWQMNETLDRVARGQTKLLAGGRAPAAEPVSEPEASRLFAVMMALESRHQGERARLYDVFVLTVLKGLTQRAVAKRCACSLGQVAKRVREVEAEFGRPVRELRGYAGRMLELRSSVKGEVTRKRKPGSPPGAYADDELLGDAGATGIPAEEYGEEEEDTAD